MIKDCNSIMPNVPSRGHLGIGKPVTPPNLPEDELERFFAVSLDMLCIASCDGYFKRLSPAFTQTLGWSVEEMLTRPFIDFVHPDDRDATLREVERQVVAGKKVLQFENRYQHKHASSPILSLQPMPPPPRRIY